MLGIVARWFDQPRERQLPEARVQVAPGGGHAWNRDRQPAALRHRSVTLPTHDVRAQTRGCAT